MQGHSSDLRADGEGMKQEKKSFLCQGQIKGDENLREGEGPWEDGQGWNFRSTDQIKA